MSKPLSLNILGQYVRDGAALLDWVSKAKPDAALVMDSVAVAQGIRQRSPQTTVIYRAYNPNDHRWHQVITPAEWINTHRVFADNGMYVYCCNEPSGYDNVTPLVDWCVSVLKLAHQQGLRLVIGNFGVGHPDEKLIINGAFDPLIRALSGSPSKLGLHEYWNINPVAEQPYHLGRFKYWLDRCDAMHVERIKIIMTEHGRDAGAK